MSGGVRGGWFSNLSLFHLLCVSWNQDMGGKTFISPGKWEPVCLGFYKFKCVLFSGFFFWVSPFLLLSEWECGSQSFTLKKLECLKQAFMP